MNCECGCLVERHAHNEYHCFDCDCGFMIMENERTSELSERNWAIITATKVIAINLTYSAAARRMSKHFKHTKDLGLRVVTNSAALRLQRR